MAIHHTMGVYLNGNRVHNGVSDEHLAQHIEYNETFRPGRALFVDGKCRVQGYLKPATIATIEAELAAKPMQMSRVTTPYR